jgi:hypothetical protein
MTCTEEETFMRDPLATLCRAAAVAVVCLLGLGEAGLAQPLGELPVDSSSRADFVRGRSPVLAWTPEEIRAHLATESYRDLTPEEADDLYLLARSRPEITVPFFETALQGSLERGALSREQTVQVIDLLSYSANDAGLKALSRLAARSENPLLAQSVSRLLDYADGWSNSYSLAYQAMALGNPAVERQVLDWVQDRADRGHGFADWASAIVQSHSASAPVEGLVAGDPILSRLTGGQAPESLRSELEKQARESVRPPQ